MAKKTWSFIISTCLHMYAVFVHTTQAATIDETPDCPENWTPFNGACYRVYTTPKSWEDADDSCQRHENSHLVSIHSLEEHNFLRDLYRSSPHSLIKGYWIGLKIQEKWDSQFWTDGTKVSYTYFKKTYAVDKCIRMRNVAAGTGVKWTSNKGCEKKLHFICKFTAKFESSPSTPQFETPASNNYDQGKSTFFLLW